MSEHMLYEYDHEMPLYQSELAKTDNASSALAVL